jgi:hypothetical protein
MAMACGSDGYTGSFELAVTCSSFSAGNLNVASIVGKDSTEISIKWQLAYSIL